MVVDIEDCDTWGRFARGVLQVRGQQVRELNSNAISEWSPLYGTLTDPVSPGLAENAIKGMGHEVKHTAPTPTYPVVRVADCTHGVRFKTGGISRLGSETDAKRAFDNINDVPGCACEIVALDWTGVGGNDKAITAAQCEAIVLSVTDLAFGTISRAEAESRIIAQFPNITKREIDAIFAPIAAKQPEPLASNANYTIEDARPDPFKVGDVVRGKVVGDMWYVRYPNNTGLSEFFYEDDARKELARRGGTVTRMAVVEVEGEPK